MALPGGSTHYSTVYSTDYIEALIISITRDVTPCSIALIYQH